jgi:putative hydrolase
VKSAGGYITTGSDSHFYDTIGEFELTSQLLTEVEMPVEKIITASARQFLDFLALRGREPIAEFSEF